MLIIFYLYTLNELKSEYKLAREFRLYMDFDILTDPWTHQNK